MIQHVGNLISGSSAFSKTSLNIWKLMIDGETVETMSDFIFLALKSLQMVIAAMKLKDAYSLEEKL